MADDLHVSCYSPASQDSWDRFVRGSRNGTFLFLRDYLDYHADRFPDASLLVESGGRLRALLPATLCGEALVSHAGLTYGGFVVDAWMTAARMLATVDAVLSHAAGTDASVSSTRRFHTSTTASRRRTTGTRCSARVLA
jgi:hypothetical protein